MGLALHVSPENVVFFQIGIYTLVRFLSSGKQSYVLKDCQVCIFKFAKSYCHLAQD